MVSKTRPKSTTEENVKAMERQLQVQKALYEIADAASDQVVARARELAWTGQHAGAIELASQELSKSRLKRDLQNFIGVLVAMAVKPRSLPGLAGQLASLPARGCG